MIQLLGFLAAMDDAKTRDDLDALLAGYGALRMAETSAMRSPTSDALIGETRKYLVLVADLVVRRILEGIVEAATPTVGQADDHRCSVLAGRLFAYGVRLHEMSYYAAAADVFAAIPAIVPTDLELRMQAEAKRAFALRVSRELDAATSAYLRLRRLADAAGDRHMRLEAELGLARVVIERNDFEAAAPLVRAVATEARASGFTRVLAKALIDLAAIAGSTGDHAGAIRSAHEAYRFVETPSGRDRILHNVAVGFWNLGDCRTAETLAGYLARSAVDLDRRVAANVMLYEIAVDRQNTTRVEQLRSWLATVPMPPDLAIDYYQAQAREFAMIGNGREAERLLLCALAIAEETSANKAILDLDTAIAELRAGRLPALLTSRLNPITPPGAQRLDDVRTSIEALCARSADGARLPQ